MRRMTETGDTRYKKIMAADAQKKDDTDHKERSSLYIFCVGKRPD